MLCIRKILVPLSVGISLWLIEPFQLVLFVVHVVDTKVGRLDVSGENLIAVMVGENVVLACIFVLIFSMINIVTSSGIDLQEIYFLESVLMPAKVHFLISLISWLLPPFVV